MGSASVLALFGLVVPSAVQAVPGGRSAQSAQSVQSVQWRGVSLAGAEFGYTFPGVHGVDYTYPTAAEVDYFAAKGMNLIRVPFRWERVQPVLNGALDAAELSRLRAVVTAATGKGLQVVLDVHNYAGYYDNGTQRILGSADPGHELPNSAFADLWRRLALEFGAQPNHVVFALMNEPLYVSTSGWVSAANAAIAAIRTAGATNLVTVQGLGWSGAQSWFDTWYGYEGVSNATAMLGITDPGNRWSVEIHQYVDDDFSGGGEPVTCGPAGTAVARTKLVEFASWARTHGITAFLGESSAALSPANPQAPTAVESNCLRAFTAVLSNVEANGDVWRGWALWAAGPWWPDPTFEPTPAGCTTGCQDSYLMDLVEPFLTTVPAPTTAWTPTNPGGGGAFNSPVVTAQGHWAVGSDLGGVWLSQDSGASWAQIGAKQGLTATHVSALATAGTTLFIGTDSGLFTSTTTGTGVVRRYASGYVSAIAVSANPNTVYAAVHAQHDALSPTIIKSTDGGQTWAGTGSTLPASLRVTGLRTHPVDPAGVWVISGTGRFAAGPAQAYLSTNGGTAFVRRDPQVGTLTDLAYAQDPNNLNLMYATTVSGGVGAVFKSVDTGFTWTNITPASVKPSGVVLADATNAAHVRLVDLDQRAGKDAFLWESVNAGSSWTKTTLAVTGGWSQADEVWGLAHSFQGFAQTLGYRPTAPNTVLWSNSQFVYSSANGGKAWADAVSAAQGGGWRSRGIDNAVAVAVEPSEADPNLLYAGYLDLGLWRSDDAGTSWKPVNPAAHTGGWAGKGGNTLSVLADPTRAGVVWAQVGGNLNNCGSPCAEPMSLLKSTDRGATWTKLSTGLPSPLKRLTGLSLAPESASTARWLTAAANGDVYLSQNDGASWARVVDCPADDCFATAHTADNGVVALSPSGIWRSWQGGAAGTWAKIALPATMSSGWTTGQNWLTDQWTYAGPTSVASSTGVLWVTVTGAGKGVFRSTDYGQTWVRVRADNHARAVAVDPASGRVYAGGSSAVAAGGYQATSSGIAYTADGGTTWTTAGATLPYPFVLAVATTPQGKVWLASPGRGVLKPS